MIVAVFCYSSYFSVEWFLYPLC